MMKRMDSVSAIKVNEINVLQSLEFSDEAKDLAKKREKEERKKSKKKDDPFSDIQFYNIGGMVLGKDFFEAKLYNNLYTQVEGFDENGDRTPDYEDKRWTFFTGTFSFLYGISNRVNLGIDMNLRSTKRSPTSNSPLDVFGFNASDTSRTAIASIGPKVRFTPFKGFRDLTMESAMWFPVAKQLEGGDGNVPPFLDWQRIQWTNSIFYIKSFLDNKVLLFAAVQPMFRVDSKFRAGKSDMIIFNKLLLSYFPTKALTVYGSGELTPTFGLGENDFSGYYFQAGIGVKYLIKDKLTLDALYSNFLAGKNSGAGQTFNLGISLITSAKGK